MLGKAGLVALVIFHHAPETWQLGNHALELAAKVREAEADDGDDTDNGRDAEYFFEAYHH